jgi:hypothetical protein
VRLRSKSARHHFQMSDYNNFHSMSRFETVNINQSIKSRSHEDEIYSFHDHSLYDMKSGYLKMQVIGKCK